jgi:hypothetical protein
MTMDTTLVDFTNKMIGLNSNIQSKLTMGSNNADLREQYQKYKNNPTETQLKFFLWLRKRKEAPTQGEIEQEAIEIFDNKMEPYIDYISRSHIIATNLQNATDITSKLKQTTDVLVNNYDEQDGNLADEIDKLKGGKNVNIRLANYYNTNYEVAEYIIKILEKIYYYTIIMLILITIFKSQYKNPLIVMRLFFMIILPFIVRLILTRTYDK